MSEGQILSAIIDFFEDDEWNFNSMEGLPVLSMGFSGKNGRWMCYAQAREAQRQFVFYSVCPINAPQNRRQAVAEYITRANYGMIIGNFEMDFNDGEVRYKTSIDVEGETLTRKLVKQLVYTNVIIMDRYLPGLMAVIYANASPTEEIAKIEAGLNSSGDEDDFDFGDTFMDEDEFPGDEDDFGGDDDRDDDLAHSNGQSPTQ